MEINPEREQPKTFREKQTWILLLFYITAIPFFASLIRSPKNDPYLPWWILLFAVITLMYAAIAVRIVLYNRNARFRLTSDTLEHIDWRGKSKMIRLDEVIALRENRVTGGYDVVTKETKLMIGGLVQGYGELISTLILRVPCRRERLG